jgi:hypothetical protein
LQLKGCGVSSSPETASVLLLPFLLTALLETYIEEEDERKGAMSIVEQN